MLFPLSKILLRCETAYLWYFKTVHSIEILTVLPLCQVVMSSNSKYLDCIIFIDKRTVNLLIIHRDVHKNNTFPPYIDKK